MKYFMLLWAGALAANRLRTYWNEWRAVSRLVLRLPQYRIADVPDGVPLRVRGHLELAEGARGLTAPLTGRECVAWRVRIEVRDKRIQRTKPWKELGVRERSRRAVLVDPTGRALLDGATKWELPFDAIGGAGHWKDLTAPQAAGIRAILTKLDVETTHPGWDHDVRIQEAVCLPGEPVVVAAKGEWELDPRARAGAYREVGRALRLGGTPADMIVTKDRWVLRRTP